MKNKLLAIVAICSTIISFTIHAAAEHTIVITNHYNKPIDFIITINPDVLPDLSNEFTLGANAKIETRVLGDEKEAYIAGEEKGKSENIVFWGVEILNQKVEFHGYMSRDIAYSWNTNTITFCSPEEYKKHGHCI